MKVSLKTLNRSYAQFQYLSSQPFPKGQGKLAYKIGRIKEQVDAEIERLNRHLKIMGDTYGMSLGSAQRAPRMMDGGEVSDEIVDAFNFDADEFMQSTIVEIWGDPFSLDDLTPYLEISAETCARLSWLIFDPEAKPHDLQQAAD